MKNFFKSILACVLTVLLIAGVSWAATLLPVSQGGTGASTVSGARSNLGLGTIATQNVGTLTNTKYCTYATGTGFVCNSDGVGSMTYPGAGIALSTGSAWDTSITNNSANWNTAYGWGNHASAGYLTSASINTSSKLAAIMDDEDGTGDCGTGAFCIGGHTHSEYLTSLNGAVLTDQSTPQTIGLTGARLAKLWATDIEVTNAITGSVSGNAGTATALASNPTDCTGSTVATAIDASGNLTCSITPLVSANIDTVSELNTIITDGDFLTTTGKAADADTLDGHDTSYFQTALTYPVTGVASPTAGYLVKWGASGNTLADGLKFGTMTDGKGCGYSTANGLVCNFDYLTANQSITLSGDVSGTGTTAITTTIGADKVKDSMIDWGSGAGQVDLADIPGGIASASVYDLGGATSVEIPNGASPTVDAAGEIAVDTTSDQLIWYGGAKRVLSAVKEKCFSLENPTDADDNIAFFFPRKAITVTDVYCEVDGGTSVSMTISDGTNALEAITCDGDGAEDDGSITNGTFTSLERMEFDLASTSGTNTWLYGCVSYVETAD